MSMSNQLKDDLFDHFEIVKKWGLHLTFINTCNVAIKFLTKLIKIGNKVSIAQKRYRSFVNAILNKKYDNPLDEVVSSTLPGGPGFIAFIKDKSLSGKKPDNALPALKKLVIKVSPKDIFAEVESVFKYIALTLEFVGSALKTKHIDIGHTL